MKRLRFQNWSGNIEVYNLQDKILNVVFSLENSFYLTGGTALHRFYYNYRVSDDLDFFTNSDPLFHEYIREIFEGLEDKNINFEVVLREKDFVRLKILNNLKIDFVNDIAYRYGKSIILGSFRIDNVINILTNKIGAIIGRDLEKDVFDIISICLNEKFNWKEIIEISKKKIYFEKEFLIYRLKTFPFEWLKNIKFLKKIEIQPEYIEIMIEDIANNRDNSLFKRS